MTYLGAPAIAAALGRKPATVYGWAKAQRRGEYSPLAMGRDKAGRLWCTDLDIFNFFNPPEQKRDRIGADVASSLARLDRPSERGGATQNTTALIHPYGPKAAAHSQVTESRQEDQGAIQSLGALVLQK